MEIRLLTETDDRQPFRSGEPDLDRYFHKYAGQNQFRHHIGTTYVAITNAQIAGFATVAPGQMELADVPFALRKRLPPYPMPVLRLARLAVDERARGRGIGEQLLKFVLTLAVHLSTDFGCLGVLVDAKVGAVRFYEKYGFEPLDLAEGESGARPMPTPMFLPLKHILAAKK